MRTKKSITDLNKIMEESQERIIQEFEDVKSKSKSLKELIVTEKFIVNDVVAKSSGTHFTPESEKIMGGSSPIYNGGFTSKLILTVSPDNHILVKILYFEGFSIIKGGDYISALIPRYEKKGISNVDLDKIGRIESRTFYFDRPFNPMEYAIELALLSPEGKVLREDRAINYREFVKQE